MSSRASSRRLEIGLLAAGLLSATLLLGAGCGRRDRGAHPPEPGAPGATAQKGKSPVAVTPSPAAGPSDKGEGAQGIALPGQNRVLPSQDPRNLAATGEPAAGAEVSAEGALSQAAPDEGEAAKTRPAGAAPSTGTAPSTSANPPSPAAPPVTGKSPVFQASSLPPPIPAGESRFRVQVLATGIPSKAFRMCDELRESLGIPVFVEPEQGISKVRVGDYKERTEAETMRRRLFGAGYADAFVVECRGR